MILILIFLAVSYCIGVAVESFLRGIDAYFLDAQGKWHRGDRERTWLASLVWPISMWPEFGRRWRMRREKNTYRPIGRGR